MQPKRRGLWLTIIGAIIMLPVAFAIFLAGTVFGVKNMANLVKEAPVVAAGSTHDFAANTTVAMFGDATGSSCSVTDPAGSPVTVENSTTGSVKEGDSTFNLLGSFTTTDAGAYKIDCGAVDVSVLSGKDAADVSKKLLMPIFVGFGGASLAGLVGLGMLITGIVKLVRSNRERTAWSQQQAYAGGYGAPTGYPYGQPQQPQQYGQALPPQQYGQPQQPPQYGQQAPPPPGPGSDQQPPTQQ